MWDLLKKNDSECARFREAIEELNGAKSTEELLKGLRPEQQTHVATCTDCLAAAEELVEIRALLQRTHANAAAPDAWFAGRVMAAIAARERELAGPVSTWIAVSKLASRLALATGALLLIASTWLYERPYTVQIKETTVNGSPEYLFESPAPPMTQDDVLISLAEKNQ